MNPRTLEQVKALDDLLAGKGEALECVLELTADTTKSWGGCERAEIEGRADDTEEVIRERMRIYAEETAPLSAVYRERGLLREVDGMGAVDEVFERLMSALRG